MVRARSSCTPSPSRRIRPSVTYPGAEFSGGHLRAGTVVVDAYVCGTNARSVDVAAHWQQDAFGRVMSGLPALLTAYGRPDAWPGGACTADARPALVIALHRQDGQVQEVRTPLDSCGHPQLAAQEAFRALGLRRVS